MSISEVIAIVGCLLAVSSTLCGALYFLLKTGFRLGKDIQANQLRILNLEQKVDDLESKLTQEMNFKKRSYRLDDEVNKSPGEGMNW